MPFRVSPSAIFSGIDRFLLYERGRDKVSVGLGKVTTAAVEKEGRKKWRFLYMLPDVRELGFFREGLLGQLGIGFRLIIDLSPSGLKTNGPKVCGLI